MCVCGLFVGSEPWSQCVPDLLRRHSGFKVVRIGMCVRTVQEREGQSDISEPHPCYISDLRAKSWACIVYIICTSVHLKPACVRAFKD